MGSVTAQSRVQWVLAQVCPGSLIFPWMPNVLPETTRRRPGLGDSPTKLLVADHAGHHQPGFPALTAALGGWCVPASCS